jgi:hypothetical protein|tara:strand:+ start:66 stop:1391 length:1326 start_codon:yes stop_codon:yes gene_type:complete
MSHQSSLSQSIQYVLNENVELVSFPFTDKNYTPETLNEALGGGQGGSPLSSSLLGDIIGEGVAAHFESGVGWIGTLQEIDPEKAYWIRPAAGGAFNTTVSINGTLLSPYHEYMPLVGANLFSYPFAVNRPFGEAVRTGSSTSTGPFTSLQNMGIHKIIGSGEVATFNFTNDTWTGNLVTNGFKSGSGYWFIQSSANDAIVEHFYWFGGAFKKLWRPFAPHLGSQTEWEECTDAGYDEFGRYGYNCGHIGHKSTGNVPSPGLDPDGHSFGNEQSTLQNFIAFGNQIGNNSSSLFDSASNDMSGSTDGSNDFVVGFFATASVANNNPFPACMGACGWFDNENARTFDWTDGTSKFVEFRINGDETGTDIENYGYAGVGGQLDVRIYDPRRSIVVTGSIHEVDYSGATPQIGAKTTLTMSANYTYLPIISGSGIYPMKCIVMDS